MKDQRFGIEIELFAADANEIARAVERAVNGTAFPGSSMPHVRAPDGRIWKLVGDNSILGPSGSRGIEVVSPILTYADVETVQAVARAVFAAGGRTNNSCGIHVHVDAGSLQPRHLVNLIKIVHKQEPLIEAALGIHAGRQQYCRSIDPGFIQILDARRAAWTMDALNRAWYGYLNHYPEHYDSTRYRAVNLHAVWEKGTVEFRWGNGTLHAGVIKTYIQFALALVHKARSQRGASSRKRVYDPASAKYDLRVFLLGLGFKGPEFKTARYHLLRTMPGNAAWKNGPPPARTRVARATEEGA